MDAMPCYDTPYDQKNNGRRGLVTAHRIPRTFKMLEIAIDPLEGLVCVVMEQPAVQDHAAAQPARAAAGLAKSSPMCTIIELTLPTPSLAETIIIDQQALKRCIEGSKALQAAFYTCTGSSDHTLLGNTTLVCNARAHYLHYSVEPDPQCAARAH